MFFSPHVCPDIHNTLHFTLYSTESFLELIISKLSFDIDIEAHGRTEQGAKGQQTKCVKGGNGGTTMSKWIHHNTGRETAGQRWEQGLNGRRVSQSWE